MTAPAPSVADLTPPTADVSEYAGYPASFVIRTGASVLTESPDPIEARRIADRYRTANPHLTLAATHVAPDGMHVITPARPGGTWGGACGSTRWVVDTDRELQRAETLLTALRGTPAKAMQRTANSLIAATQAHWLNGFLTTADGVDGFRVQCQQPPAHAGLCGFRELTWDPSTGTPVT